MRTVSVKSVKQVLSQKGAEVHCIEPDATVRDALERMAATDVGALVVVSGVRVVGMFSERDYARKVILLGKSSKDTPVADAMSKRVVSVAPTHRVDHCMRLMTEQRVRHLPVLERGRLVGLISIGDAVKAIMEDQRSTIEELEHYIAGTPPPTGASGP